MLNSFQKRSFKRKRIIIKNSAADWLGKKRFDKPNIVHVFTSLGGSLQGQTGRATLALCPYHDDRKASLALYVDTASFYCFTCAKSGNAYQLIMDKLGMSFKDALNYCRDNNLYDN